MPFLAPILPYGRIKGLGTLIFVLLLAASSLTQPLIISAAQPLATPMATPAANATLHPSADAHVMPSRPTENFGEAEALLTDLNPRSDSFIRFDVMGIGDKISKVTLRLWVINPTPDAPSVWSSANSTWPENEVTWNTRPAVETQITNAANAPDESWLEYDVTNAINGDGSYTFVLMGDGEDGLDVSSREAEVNQPELVIATGQALPGGNLGGSEQGVPVLLAAGDIGRCETNGDELTAKIVAQQPGTIAALGDIAYESGGREEFARCYDPSWGQFKDRTMPVPGNHDYRTEGARGYFEYFGPNAGDPDLGYYSYDLGTWHVIALNSNIDMSVGSPQEKWLRQDLEAHPVACTVAYWHHPRFSSGEEHGNNVDVEPLFQALYDHGADVVLNGHEHDYERFAPQTPDGVADRTNGIRQFVVGTGGTYLRDFGEIQQNSEVRNNETLGVLRLTLYPGSYAWQFLPVEGKTFSDMGTDTCHDAPPEVRADTGSPVAWWNMDRRKISMRCRRIPIKNGPSGADN